MSDKVDSDSEVDFEEVKKTIKEMKAHARAINKEARDLDAVYKRSGLEGNTPRSRVHTVESDVEEPEKPVRRDEALAETRAKKAVKIIVSEPTSAEESEVKPVKAPKKVVKKELESEASEKEEAKPAKKSVTPVASDASDDSEVEPAYQKMKGTREQVYEGIAYMTSGGLKKKDIFFENGLYKSLKMSKGAKDRFGKDKQ